MVRINNEMHSASVLRRLDQSSASLEMHWKRCEASSERVRELIKVLYAVRRAGSMISELLLILWPLLFGFYCDLSVISGAIGRIRSR